jgi:hypothetical protein
MKDYKEINMVIEAYFTKNPSITIVPAKKLMGDFISAGIFVKDHKNGLPIRKILKELDKTDQLDLIPLAYAERNEKDTYWYFIPSKEATPATPYKQTEKKKIKPIPKYVDSDESYVIDLCDIVLNLKANRKKRFGFLLGDLHQDGKSRTKLPVDSHYDSLNLVVELMEKEDTNDAAFKDKPNGMTASGVNRDKQRKLYDSRKRELIPKKGINLVIVSHDDFKFDSNKKIVRDKEKDLKTIEKILKDYVAVE